MNLRRLCTRLYKCIPVRSSRVYSVADSLTHGSFSIMLEIFPLQLRHIPLEKNRNISVWLKVTKHCDCVYLPYTLCVSSLNSKSKFINRTSSPYTLFGSSSHFSFIHFDCFFQFFCQLSVLLFTTMLGETAAKSFVPSATKLVSMLWTYGI